MIYTQAVKAFALVSETSTKVIEKFQTAIEW